MAHGGSFKVHLAFSAFFDVVFAGIAGALPALGESPLSLPVSTSVYGFALWVLNFHVVAPAAGWAWLPAGSLPSAQLLAHTFAFGTVPGLHLDRTLIRPRRGAIRLSAAEPFEHLRRVG